MAGTCYNRGVMKRAFVSLVTTLLLCVMTCAGEAPAASVAGAPPAVTLAFFFGGDSKSDIEAGPKKEESEGGMGGKIKRWIGDSVDYATTSVREKVEQALMVLKIAAGIIVLLVLGFVLCLFGLVRGLLRGRRENRELHARLLAVLERLEREQNAPRG